MPKSPKLLQQAPDAPSYLNIQLSLPDGSVLGQLMLSPFQYGSGKTGYFVNGRTGIPGVVWADNGEPAEFMTNYQLVAIGSQDRAVAKDKGGK